MAIYRSVYMSFWKDTKVVDDFSPEDRYFMLYCLTNDYTNLCGCFEISIKQMSQDTGYNTEIINKLLERFEKIHKVIFYNKQNKELLIKNWHKYNWTKSEKLDKPLLKEIQQIKTIDFKRFLINEYNKRDTVLIPYTYGMDTSVAVAVADTVADTDAVISENDNVSDSCVDGLQSIIDFYNNNIGLITPYGLEVLSDYAKDMPEDLIILAMKKAVEANKRTIQYIKGILNNWYKKGIKSVLDAEQEDEKFRNRNTPQEETEGERIARKIKEMEEMTIIE